MTHSPFPGMDPYLEGYLWADVHQALAYQFRRQLAPLVAPKYAVRLAITMITDRVPTQELGIMYPDVEVVRPFATQADIWPILLRNPLPVLPVPLLPGDGDVPLDMQAALDTIYADAQYGLTIDYTAVPPPPTLSKNDGDWAARRVEVWME